MKTISLAFLIGLIACNNKNTDKEKPVGAKDNHRYTDTINLPGSRYQYTDNICDSHRNCFQILFMNDTSLLTTTIQSAGADTFAITTLQHRYTLNRADSTISILMSSGYLASRLKYEGDTLRRYILLPDEKEAPLENDPPYHRID